jgi:hypothetical protein
MDAYSRTAMATALGLVGIVVFICCVIALAAAVTWAVVRLTPEPRKPEPPAG